MASWYVRDRGRVMGPLTTAQVLELRDRGQIQGYHEVSTDRRAWRAVDLVPELSADGPPPPPRRAPGPPPAPAARAPANTHTYKLIVGGVLAVVVLGGLAVGGAVMLRNRGGGDGGDGGRGGDGQTPVGVVGLTGKSAQAQAELLRASVCLVVCGMHVRHSDGSEQEALSCLRVPEPPNVRFHFGSTADFLVPGKKVLLPGHQVVQGFGTGSGFAVTPGGYIITNKHVVESVHNFGKSDDRLLMEKVTKARIEPRVWVFFGRGSKFLATIVHVSGDYDLAVLKIDRPDGAYLPLCSTVATKIPSTLTGLSTVGFPGISYMAFTEKDDLDALQRRNRKVARIEGLFPDRAFAFSNETGGIITEATQNEIVPGYKVSWILQHSAKVAAGNSGGPLIAPDGLVLGINSWRVPTGVEGNQYFALTLPQLRDEIDAATNRGATWRELPR